MTKAVASPQYAELAELAGSFIHEIKNHLSTLGLNLQLLAEDFQDPQSHRERRALERIQRLQGECGRLVDVANDFLQFARLQELELTPGSLAEVIGDLIDFFGPTARQANIEIKCYLPADLPAVELNRELLSQAFLNLMLNAQQAMPEGGELTIQASVEPAPSDQESKGITLVFIDTGKGIAPEVLGRVFRPFFSTKPGGTGLGLPTARKIIEAHGGTIEVQSEVGRGTRFKVWLPAADAC
jgi:signal transduction histidine kinase